MVESLPIIIFVASLLVDLLVFVALPKSPYFAKYLSVINVCLISFFSTVILIATADIYSILLVLSSIFRIVNLARVAVARMAPKELKSRYGRSTIWLDFISALMVCLIFFEISTNIFDLILVLSLAGSSILFVHTVLAISRWRYSSTETHVLSEIPTVSVCIPARNETQDLPGCIESVLASKYPKLEIIVLDDCSHDKTPAIIKEYAHQGVRFIKGQEPDSNWIAKNSAMNKLFEESKSEIVVFLGVDVRLNGDSVNKIVEFMDTGHDMISVLPRRSETSEKSVFIQPLRYWWELAVPRLFGARPPVLSTLWAVKRDRLKAVGGLVSVKKSVQPERHFAKRLKSTYRFVISDKVLNITSVKQPSEQFDTALRTRYPQAKRRPETVMLLMVAELIIFVLPLFGLIYGLLNSLFLITIISLISSGLLITTNLLISGLVVKRTWFISLFSLPFFVLEDFYILVRSMLAYEFGVVAWKERNICLPMFQVEKELPKI